MEVLSNGTEKIPAQIVDYKEYHTDVTVRFVVNMAPVTKPFFITIFVQAKSVVYQIICLLNQAEKCCTVGI